MSLIVFEGPEGVGKTTQLRLLSEWLSARGRTVVAVREPGGTPLGDEIRRLLLDPQSDIAPRAESLLFMASRAQLVEREITPALESGAIVLLDRYFLSTYAYQVAGRGLPHEEIVAANRLATSALRPELTLLLSMPVSEGLARAAKRGGPDRMERADAAFHDRVARAFADFATHEWQDAHPEAGPVMIVDARGSVKDVFERVLASLNQRWPGTFS
ncbi:MAG TPA: dTMP kinase [Gemmatimonadaceae bacterium]|nr:dTMP kinase [Gemmatimonadaceae bacterium]